MLKGIYFEETLTNWNYELYREMMINNNFKITGIDPLDVSVHNIETLYALDSAIHQVLLIL